MGMAACFAAIDTRTLERFGQDPTLLEEYLFPDNGESEPPNSIDVDKAWHAIHYMLTGVADGGAEPLSLAVLGGQDIGDDMGYGPARFLVPEQVGAVHRALEVLGTDGFRARFAPQAMTRASIYPESIWEREGEGALDYVMRHYELLKTFYAAAASRGDAALLWLC